MATNPAGQYATDRNLRARQRLWESQTPPFDLVAWTLGVAGIARGDRVLDVGCGNGRHLTAMRSLGVDAVGCDLSLGMLARGDDRAVVAADAVALPFRADAFDVVLAPHMLYHVADRPAAAHEFRRVLTAGGRCVAVTNGAGHLASLRRLVQDVADHLQPGWVWVDRMSDAFSLENGSDQLAVAFDEVRLVRPDQPGRAVVTDPDVVADYLASVGDIYGRDLSHAWDRLVDQVRIRAAQVIEDEACFVVEGDVGALVCT
ncbi:MAG: class I SAM-dependent methyltransferase [Acidimicrobiales bacterium]